MTLGVVGPDDPTRRIVEATGDVSGETLSGDPVDVLAADPDVVVAAGERALTDLVRADVSVPVLSVDAGPGIETVPLEGVASAVGRLADGAYETFERAVLTVTTPETVERGSVRETRTHSRERVRGCFDVTLMTTDPARISEYAVRTDGERVNRFRADGVVVATPAGSRGYARAAHGPIVGPGCDVVAVVPVAPFAIAADRWVLPDERIRLTVERDEEPVTLSVDGETVGPIEPGTPVEVGRDGSLRLVSIPETRSPFD